MTKETAPSTHQGLDVRKHLRNKNYSRKILFARIAWRLVMPFFNFSPRPFHNWRSALLRMFGAKIGKSVKIYPSAKIHFPWNLNIQDNVIIGWRTILYALEPITIESDVMISQYVHICTGSHDYTQPSFPLKNFPIIIHKGSWVSAEAFIGPGVIIGARSIVGARAVVVKHIPENSVVGGNPAKIIKTLA